LKNPHKVYIDIARRFAQESHCLSYQVACIAVKNGRIISTGINGTPPGMENCDDHWKNYYKSNPSLCLSYQMNEWFKTPEWRELHHAFSLKYEVHAEMNVLATAARDGVSLQGCDFYCTTEPCNECLKTLIMVAPHAIYYDIPYDKVDNSEMRDYLNEKGIIFKEI
jgi:dCMP deaminase